MRKTVPATPVAPWMGGKKALHRRIIERIEAIPHRTYVEPFLGMGGVFLRRSWRPRLEVANDLNGEITNLFRVLQRHYPQLMEVMRFQITSRREFERLRACDPATLTDLERAARFLYLQRLAFGGQLGGVFGVAPDQSARFSLAKIGPLLDAAHDRLDGVVFENLPWQEVLARYDGPQALFYLDPPYWGGEDDYGKGLFDRDQFAELAERLGRIEGAFVLSINDRPEIRDLFGAFRIEEVRLNYSVSKGGATAARELIIANREVMTGLV
ncbi:DNA methyltransferase [Rhodovulum sulfidophilum]|uniref:site-specific DNA-methyltransferase (adenine-specific) n=1 Tax=Rhodovulum visakhapatnamense TaxID=364297 RepID=A0ABS1RJI7_9RHOB|nr:DNA adenine methylase [Rhodovulum visakhapatnamense]MBL3571590.1 DNA adenine methylase [Rhodovulum visakhapatnamense]MBL3579679.1 DNA adenine methylase [Rhodovulum visakhapatnamense]OLS46781.1 DNA methyltransferase [Rhodovulum sulfidophilum]